MAWLAQWKYRKQFLVSRSAGAISNYQIKLTITTSGLSYHCLESFNDIRFTNEAGDVLNYWIESITGTSPDLTSTIWVKLDYIGTSSTNFYLYYGNNGATSFTNGTSTFEYFLDKNSTTGWTGSENIVISTVGDFLNFYYGSSGYAYKQKYMSSSYQKRSTWLQMKNTDISNNEIDVGFKNNTLNCGLIKIGTVASGGQSHWYTTNYDSEFEAGDWVEGTEYKFKLSFDETTSGTSIYQYNLSDQLVSSQTDLTFTYENLLPTLSSGISIASDYPFSYSLRHLFTTDLLTSEPSIGSFGEEELPFVGLASDNDYRDGDTKVNKIYLGTAIIYRRQPKPPIATGGNISYYGDYKIHTFLSSGNFIVTYAGDYEITYLIVAGGGGSGEAVVLYTASGGGGGGGVVSGSFSNLDLGTYPVTVGSGGAINSSGNNSTFNSIIAYGGGRGSSHYYPTGHDGGCGGGGHAGRYGSAYPGGSGSQGFNGGNGAILTYALSGGGGGMGAVGGNGGGTAANGGNGIISSITGASVYYGGGGAGSNEGSGTFGNGGLGGGGGSSNKNGTPNTGGGGAGGYVNNIAVQGGIGGSGIVIIRYKNI